MVEEKDHIVELVKRYPSLSGIREPIAQGYRLLETCYENGGKVLIAGNGGSAADAEHMAGELMKRFRLPRPIGDDFAERLKDIDSVRGAKLIEGLEQALPAIPLVAHESMITAYMNDVDATGVFAQQMLGYGEEGDVFIGISTSGNSENIVYAAVTAKAMGISVLGLIGSNGGKLAEYADVSVGVPERETYLVQELHLPIYHCWCMMLEERFFGVL